MIIHCKYTGKEDKCTIIVTDKLRNYIYTKYRCLSTQDFFTRLTKKGTDFGTVMV